MDARGAAWRSPNGRLSRSIRSSTSIHRTTRESRSACRARQRMADERVHLDLRGLKCPLPVLRTRKTAGNAAGRATPARRMLRSARGDRHPAHAHANRRCARSERHRRCSSGVRYLKSLVRASGGTRQRRAGLAPTRHADRGRRRQGDGIGRREAGLKLGCPVMHGVAAQSRHHGLPALLALVERHLERAGDGRATASISYGLTINAESTLALRRQSATTPARRDRSDPARRHIPSPPDSCRPAAA